MSGDKVNKIFNDESKRLDNFEKRKKSDCEKLLNKLEYLVKNPISKSKFIDEVKPSLQDLFHPSAVNYYHKCDNVHNFVSKHNDSISPIKIYISNNSSFVNYISTNISIYTHEISYTLKDI